MHTAITPTGRPDSRYPCRYCARVRVATDTEQAPPSSTQAETMTPGAGASMRLANMYPAPAEGSAPAS